LGKSYIKQNFPNDEIDNSQTKKDSLDIKKFKNASDYDLELMTIRITDHDGNWKNSYDSIIICELELDNGYLINESMMTCVKSTNQFCPISSFS
jgi:hypothetical protein